MIYHSHVCIQNWLTVLSYIGKCAVFIYQKISIVFPPRLKSAPGFLWHIHLTEGTDYMCQWVQKLPGEEYEGNSFPPVMNQFWWGKVFLALCRTCAVCDNPVWKIKAALVCNMDQGTVDSPVTLVIKAPNQKYDDQTINCFLNWTVEKLKKHISKVYPSKPVSVVLLCNNFIINLMLPDLNLFWKEQHLLHFSG